MNLNSLKETLSKVLEKDGYSLYNLSLTREGKDTYLHVFVDKDDALITMDEIVLISEKLNVILDELDPIASAYILDVSTAGAEKEVKLDKLAHYLNRYIKVTLNDKEPVFGTLLSVSEDTLEIKVNLKGRMKVLTLPVNEVKKVNLAIK